MLVVDRASDSFAGPLEVPYSLDVPFGFLDLADLGRVAALVLTQDGHAGATYELATRVAGIPVRIVPVGANGQPAFGYYRAPTSDGPFTLRAVQVLTFLGGAIARVDHFMNRTAFGAFGLPDPLTLPQAGRDRLPPP